MALKLSGSISLTGSLTTDSHVIATAVTSSFFTGSYLDSFGHTGSADEILISDGRGGSIYKEVVIDENTDVRPASANKFSISWQDNLNFTASATSVYIPGEDTARSQLGQKNITLAAADSTHPRFDVFIFSGSATDPSSGSIEVVQGTASENPIYPDIDPGNEVPLKFILLKAGASVPSDGSDENNTNGANFAGSTVFSDNADDGNSWKSFGSSATSANITTSTGNYGASYFDQFDYANTLYGNAIKWPRTGAFRQEASSGKQDRFGFWHPDYNSEGSGLTLGTLDALEFDLKIPTSVTGSRYWQDYVKKGSYPAYLNINLTEAQRRNSDGTINRVAAAAYARVNFRDFVDLTRDDFQKISIPANSFQGTGNGGAGSKIILIDGYLYKRTNGFGPFPPAGDGLYIKNLRWVDGSGAAPIPEPTGKSISQGSAARPAALSGKQNTLAATAVSSVVVSGENNKVTTKRSFIGSGRYNLIAGNTDSVIGGGSFNSSSNACTFIGGGSNNILTGSAVSSSIIGGLNNSSSLANTHIIGSNITADKANYTYVNNLSIEGVVSGSTFSGSFVGDGTNLTGVTATLPAGVVSSSAQFTGLTAPFTGSFTGSFIGDGSGLTGISGGGGGVITSFTNQTNNRVVTSAGSNTLNGESNLTFDGSTLTAKGNNFKLIAGANHTNDSNYSSIAGGYCNKITGSICAFIGGGNCNEIRNDNRQAFIGGGSRNIVDDSRCAAIVGGSDNTISGSSNSFIGGGDDNYIGNNDINSTIGGGRQNCVTGAMGTIAGGASNTAGYQAAIIGGIGHQATGIWSVVGGGLYNDSLGSRSIVGGGTYNTASGAMSGILGGQCNHVTHDDSFAVGSNLTSTADCTLFVNNLYSTGSVGSNNVVILANLPTSDPTNAGQLWNDSGTLKISAG